MHIYVLKVGWLVGRPFEKQCCSYGVNQITGVEIRHSLLSGVVEILSAADRNTMGKNFWGGDSVSSARMADNMITFQVNRLEAMQQVVSMARQMMDQAVRQPPHGLDDVAGQIEKFACLRDKGVLTEYEFQRKKQQLLGL